MWVLEKAEPGLRMKTGVRNQWCFIESLLNDEESSRG